jgi:uncharacterized protein YegP (UPF0339 family)
MANDQEVPMAQEPAKWTFELHRVGNDGKVSFVIKSEEGSIVARSEPLADMASATKAIEFIQGYSSGFKVVTFPG